MVIQENHCFVTYLIMAFCTKHHADIKQVLKYWRRFARNSKYPRSCRPAKMPAQLPFSALRSSTSKRGSSTSFFEKGKRQDRAARKEGRRVQEAIMELRKVCSLTYSQWQGKSQRGRSRRGATEEESRTRAAKPGRRKLQK